MPWTTADADRHIRGLTPEQKRAWPRVANDALKRCLAAGGKRETCEASAVRQANAAAKGVKESMPPIVEAATIKARIQGLLRAADGLLADRALPKPVREEIAGMRAKLKKRWQELEGEEEDATPAPAVAKAVAGADGLRAGFLAEAQKIIDTAGSFEERRSLVQAALRAKYPPPADKTWATVWIRDVFEDSVIYSDESGPEGGAQLWQAAYSVDRTGAEPKVILGDPKVVRQAYVVEEAQASPGDVELAGEIVPLMEKAVKADGTVPLKLIQPGWGSSGYYSPETLKRDGPVVFKTGTQMFWDHPTAAEEAQRPEGSLRDLAAQLSEDGHWVEDGPAGPGIYAEAKVFGPYRAALNELAGDIGVSIRGFGKARQGEAEGRSGPLIERLVAAKSVDFVTQPGAGGRVLELFEAARGRSSPLAISAVNLQELKRTRPDLVEELRAEIKSAVYGDSNKLKEARKMTEEQIKALGEQNQGLTTDNARLREALVLREAKEFVAALLAKTDIPELTRTRLAEALVAKPVVKDGKLDADAYTAAINEAVKAEVEYLAGLKKSGQIRDMGGSAAAPDAKAEVKESFRRMWLLRGESPEKAEQLAALAAEGR